MESVLLNTPGGISARLGWDPKLDEATRVSTLARELVATHANVEPKRVRITYEAPAQFGHRVQLQAFLDGEPVALTIKRASFRAATVVGISDPALPLGFDLRDPHPDEAAEREMRRHSHLFDGGTIDSLVAHWTRVQAVLEADGRGARVHPEHVRLDTALDKGWVPDRHVHYAIKDISRDAWVITVAYGAIPA